MKNGFVMVCAGMVLLGCNREDRGGSRGGMSAQVGSKTGRTEAPAVVSERGRDFRVWKTFRSETLPDGKTFTQTNSYVELAGGMHYWENGAWHESQALIEPLQDGAIANRGPLKVSFAANLNTRGALSIFTEDGKTLRSHVVGLAYFDAQSGNSAWIAQAKDSVGVIVAQNQVLYEDAFTDVKADVRYTYKRSSIEQDVILRQNDLPDPAVLGLNAESTRLQVVTEFVQSPVPRIKQTTIERESDPVRRGAMRSPDFNDQTLGFDELQFIRGKAFSLADGKLAKVPVGKSWESVNGKNFLVEAVKFHSIRPHLEALPKAAAIQRNDEKVVARKIVPQNVLLAQVQSPPLRPKARPMEMASRADTRHGFVIDFQAVSSGSNFTFQGDITYYVTGEVYLDGTTTIEGGTVIKFGTAAPFIYCLGPAECKTDFYRPAVFTAKDDNTVGENITGSTGSPSGIYANAGLICSYSSSPIQHVRVSYAEYGVAFVFSGAHVLRHSQFRKVKIPIFGDMDSTVQLQNILFDGITGTLTEGWGGPTSQMLGEHLTIHRAAALTSGSVLTLTNSILSLVTNLGSFTGVSNATNDNDTAVFQTVGSGGHYLASESPYRNVGTTNIAPALAKDLRKMTTYPPIGYSNAVIAAPVTLFPQASRDTDTPDLGYHYYPLDYAFGGTDGNADFTFAPGTAVGWFRTSSGFGHVGHGLHMDDRKIVTFDGRVDAPCYWVRCSTVQEGGTGLWEGGYGPGGITGWADQALEDVTLSPEIHARFTKFSVLATEGHMRDDYGYLILRANHCEFYSGSVGAYIISFYLTNCLSERCAFGQITGWPGTGVAMRNCTLRGANFGIDRYASAMPVSVRDTAFDGTAISVNDGYASNPSVTDYANNAFLTTGERTTPTNLYDVLVTNFNWQTGSLGNRYLPTNSTLINAGSRNATNAGLFHFTVLTNNVKETNTIVDIGFHYVATDGIGTPLDYDGDGIPDYWEDGNGNGSVDSGETDWKNANDLGLRVYITRPRSNSTIP